MGTVPTASKKFVVNLFDLHLILKVLFFVAQLTQTSDVTVMESPPPEALKQKIGFIGGGQMALALANGFISSGLITPSQILASAPSDNNLVLP